MLRVEVLEQVAQEFRGTSGNDKRDADSCGGVLGFGKKFAVDHDGGTFFVSHFGFSCFLDVVFCHKIFANLDDFVYKFLVVFDIARADLVIVGVTVGRGTEVKVGVAHHWHLGVVAGFFCKQTAEHCESGTSFKADGILGIYHFIRCILFASAVCHVVCFAEITQS